jgi:phosphoglycerate kinase
VHTLDDLLASGVAGRTVLVRSDLNVPLDGSVITDDGRIRASLPTLQALLLGGAKVVVTAHLGRPKGAPDQKYSLAPAAARLGELLGVTVPLADDLVGPSARETVAALKDGQLAMLENVRFDGRETSKDADERGQLADDLVGVVGPDAAYVSDGFGVVHRKQASVYEIAQRLPHYAGYLVSNETAVLKKLTVDPGRPYVVVLGGSKVSDKLGVITSLLPRVDSLLIGGGMAFTFLAAQGHGVGSSLLQEDQIGTCQQLLADNPDKIVLPTDVVIADAFSADAAIQIVTADRQLAGPGHRPGEQRELLPDRLGRIHRLLERADGRVRAGPVRGRHQGGGRGDRRVVVVLGGRRRRLRGGRAHPGHRRIRLHPHLDRRWCVPGVPRGQRAPRSCRTGGMNP